MAKGTLEIKNLNDREYRAATAAVKLVRGSALKNAYMEGFCDGFTQCGSMHRNGRPVSEEIHWKNSHTKAMSDNNG